MREAARALVGLGARAALVTGGHLAGEATDVLCDRGVLHTFSVARLPGPAPHGTGCALSAAIAAALARGQSLEAAVALAKRWVTRAIAGATRLGRGTPTLDHFAVPDPTLRLE
jgi:hydroxymethylpyrimidine/phosphomethylpyrimidine kinase